jgi:secreted trypsin-like serine protease
MMKLAAQLLSFCLMLYSTNSVAIVNGAEVDDDDALAKHVVALQLPETLSDGSIYYHKGTGIILSNNLILTAGHNFYYLQNPETAEAIFSVSPVWGQVPAKEIRINIKKVMVHPAFQQTKRGTQDDLAVVLLAKPIPAGYSPLPLADKTSRVPDLRENAITTGYGTNVDIAKPPIEAFRLRQTSESFLFYSDTTFKASKKIWFDQSSSGICSGDSGGPVIFNSDGEEKIYGIAIHTLLNENGKMACLTQGAFTNVVYYHDWINETAAWLAKAA